MTKDKYSVQSDGVSFLTAFARAYFKLTARRLAGVFAGPSRIHRGSPWLRRTIPDKMPENPNDPPALFGMGGKEVSSSN
ncbi:MAG: hypothetical protein M1378_11295 [Bacteroidetes bacterium]|nr:hypothetical protein [Bacteroidota bacterium]